jgi:hypothetical protein
MMFWAFPGFPQELCDAGTLFEPYAQICAPVNDVRDQFLPQATESSGSPFASKTTNASDQGLGERQAPVEAVTPPEATDLPVPGGFSVGTTYRELPTVNSGRLHTRMFVHPEGLQPDGPLPVLYTTATSHMHHGLEVLVAYAPTNPGGGRLWLYAWPCLPDYACPDGDTSPGWQWFRELSSLTCNITQAVDQGGHAQKLLYYANHTDKLDEGMPPLWKSAVYLWNYCDDAWDLAWEHTYREAKVDCSVPGSGCAWWGPGIETFGTDPYPQISELGYEYSLLYHDGAWSELRWPEAGFRDPAIWATSTPWLLFHLDPNRGYGVGNSFDMNDPPAIDAQQPLQVLEDETLTVDTDSLDIFDPDVDPVYHVAFDLTLYGGDNYSRDGRSVIPDPDYFGTLSVPVTVSDGAADSQTFELQIDVTPVNDAPTFTSMPPAPSAVDQGATYTYVIAANDVDGDAITISAERALPGWLGLVDAGNGTAVLSGTPANSDVGVHNVTLRIQDGTGAFTQQGPIEITVINVDDLPVFASSPNTDATEAVDYVYVITAADPDGDAMTITAPTLPAWLTLVDNGLGNALLSGTPTGAAVGANTVVLQVQGNPLFGTVTQSFSIDVVSAPEGPTIILIGNATVTVNQGSSYTEQGATASDPQDGDLTAQIGITGAVNTAVLGSYLITYTVSDTAGNEIATQRVVTVRIAPAPPSSGGGSGGGCFIATAAYGSYLDPHVLTLRHFRDTNLLTNGPGRLFVAAYYKYSPPIAAVIEKNETLRILTRLALTPVGYAVAYPRETGTGLLLFLILGIQGVIVRRSERS